MRPSAKGGFTLIEVIVAITILSVLAAFAVPRFASIERQARIASRDALASSVRSTAALVHALWLAEGGAGSAVTLEGRPIAIENGYPAAESIALALADYTGYALDGGEKTTTFANDRVPTCRVTYTEARPGSAPAVVTTGPC